MERRCKSEVCYDYSEFGADEESRRESKWMRRRELCVRDDASQKE